MRESAVLLITTEKELITSYVRLSAAIVKNLYSIQDGSFLCFCFRGSACKTLINMFSHIWLFDSFDFCIVLPLK